MLPNLNEVYDQWVACYSMVAWTQKLTRVEMVNMIPTGTAAIEAKLSQTKEWGLAV